MENRKTVKDNYNAIRAFLVENNADNSMVEFLDSRIAMVERKNASRTEKAKETQLVNVDLMNEIYEAMEEGKRYRVSEINKFDFLKDYTMNKVNYLVRGLKLDGRVSKIEEKGVAYFTKA